MGQSQTVEHQMRRRRTRRPIWDFTALRGFSSKLHIWKFNLNMKVHCLLKIIIENLFVKNGLTIFYPETKLKPQPKSFLIFISTPPISSKLLMFVVLLLLRVINQHLGTEPLWHIKLKLKEKKNVTCRKSCIWFHEHLPVYSGILLLDLKMELWCLLLDIFFRFCGTG